MEGYKVQYAGAVPAAKPLEDTSGVSTVSMESEGMATMSEAGSTMPRPTTPGEESAATMQKEFLSLTPADVGTSTDTSSTSSAADRNGGHAADDPLVRKRRGSTDFLDRRKMRTMYVDYTETSRKFKLRFNLREFDPESVRVTTDGHRIIVRATRVNSSGEREDFQRKIAKPRDVKADKLKSFLTSDRILIVEAATPMLGKLPNSPSKSSQGTGSHNSLASSTRSVASRSNSASPSTPSAKPKYGMPSFHGEENERHLSLVIDIGHEFHHKEITVQVINDQCIQVRAKHQEKSSDRLKKCKFNKEYELSEKIETHSLRAALTSSGKLVVGALGKGHVAFTSKREAGDAVSQNIKTTCSEVSSSNDLLSCNVLDLASFPPTAAPPLDTSAMSTSATSNSTQR